MATKPEKRRRKAPSPIQVAQAAARRKAAEEKKKRQPKGKNLQLDKNAPSIGSSTDKRPFEERKAEADKEREERAKQEAKEGNLSGKDQKPGTVNTGPTGLMGLMSPVAEAAKGILAEKQAAAAASATQEKQALADPNLYGTRTRVLANRQKALEAKRLEALKRQGKLKDAVYMGEKDSKFKAPRMNKSEEDTWTTVKVDNVVDASMMLSWLAMPDRYELILQKARDAGLAPKDDQELEQVWKKALERSSLAYAAGQKVTPWAAMALMAKNMGPGGRPEARTTTETAFDDVDPATARRMVESAARELLGRDPSRSQVDDFIAKAQLVAKQNPRVTKTTTQYDYAGQAVSSESHSTGGADGVNDQMILEAEELAKADPEYAEYQAAGVYMPELFNALASPV